LQAAASAAAFSLPGRKIREGNSAHSHEVVMHRLRTSFLLSLVAAGLAAQEVDIPVRNWTVPTYRQASNGVTTMTDVTNPVIFVGVSPCRIADTRAINGFTGQAAGPALASFMNRNFQITGSPGGVPAPPNGCPGGTIPPGAEAVSVQFTVVTPTASGNLVAWDAGGSTPNVSVLNWDTGTVAQGSGTIVPLSFAGAIAVRLNTAAAGQTAHLVIDVNGYFGGTLGNTFNSFGLTNNSGNATAYFTNESTGCSSGCAVDAFSYSLGQGKAISGKMNYLGNNSAGVYGGHALGLTGAVYPAAGVRGESPATGVVGIAREVGTGGSVVDGSGNVLVEGYLAFNPSFSATNYGVWSTANYGGAGAKFFVEPHPTDPSKVIRYIALEGREAGTYFRGRGRFQRGLARIAVPEDFRMVTDGDGLTVQITPIGPMATFSVVKADLNEVVVQASRNVEFYYLVQGVRRTHKHLTSPIGEGGEFMPRTADAKMPLSLTDGQKELLIRNGTYLPDGSANLETARRLGWDRVWAERERPTPRASE
jgi:hypothetical protein